MELPRYAVLDGGFASLLAEQGFEDVMGDPLFGARLLRTDPEAVYRAHWAWLEAGADVIETATYQASVDGLHKHLGLDKEQALQLMEEGVRIALKAREEFWNKHCTDHPNSDRVKPLVAGSCGPYGACLLDGSEYTGAYVGQVSDQELIDWHRPRMTALLHAGVDLLAFETLPSDVEGRAVVKLLQEVPSARAWVSFSCKDGAHTSRGELFSAAAGAAAASPQVIGVGINCTAPQHVTALLRSLRDGDTVQGKRTIVYPNSGEDWTPDKKWHGREACTPVSEYVSEWVREGAAEWVGGCCRVFPADIVRVRAELHRAAQGR